MSIIKNKMLKYIIAAREAKNHFGELLDIAQKAPVTIEKKGRPVAIVISLEEYQQLKSSKEAIPSPIDFKLWIGYARKAPQNLHPKFHSDDDLWKEDD